MCQNRFYDPTQGRWINRDPIGYAGGANLYEYCGSGPVSWIDPTGNGKLKIIKIGFENLGKKKVKKRGSGGLSKGEAVNTRKRGGNVGISGGTERQRRRLGKEIEDQVPGDTIYHSASDHGQQHKPAYDHFQSNGADGHTFLIPSVSVPFANLGDFVGGPCGTVIDFMNPLSDLQDLLNMGVDYLNNPGLTMNPEDTWPVESGLPMPNGFVPGRSWSNPIRY